MGVELASWTLLPSSDAKKGPLSDLTARGSAFVTTFARGIQLSGAIIGSVLHIVFSNAMVDMQASIGGWFNVGLNIVDAMAAGIITGATAIYNALSSVFASLAKPTSILRCQRRPTV